MSKQHAQTSKAGRNPTVKDDFLSSGDEIDEILGDHNNTGRVPMTASERKRREKEAAAKIVRCKFCFTKQTQLQNLKRHVETAHPKFYSPKLNRSDCVAPPYQTDALDPEFLTHGESMQHSEEDESVPSSSPTKRAKHSEEEKKEDQLDLRKDL
jgi:hypothetical protein